MAKRIITYLFGLIVAVILLLPGIALFVDDAALTEMLEDAPVLGPYTQQIVTAKSDAANALADTVADAIAGLDAAYMSIVGPSSPSQSSSRKVVIVLNTPPQNGTIRPSAPAQTPSPPPVAPPTAASAPAAPPPSQKNITASAKKPAPAKIKAPVTKTAKSARKAAATPDASADQDHKRGLLFYKGIGVDKDFKKAAQWFRRAAKKNHSGAQYNLGIMSYLGQGLAQDYAQAAHWFQKAGEQDHAAAQYNLGFLYFEGKGVAKDDLQAFMWIDRSANLGDEKAVRARDTLQKALPKKIFSQ